MLCGEARLGLEGRGGAQCDAMGRCSPADALKCAGAQGRGKTVGRSSKLNGAASKLAEGTRVRGCDGDWTGSGVQSSPACASQVAQKI